MTAKHLIYKECRKRARFLRICVIKYETDKISDMQMIASIIDLLSQIIIRTEKQKEILINFNFTLIIST